MRRPVAAALHRLALCAYPRAFRARIGDDLHATFLDRVTHARTRLGAVTVCAAGVVDALASGCAERAADARVRRRTRFLAPPDRSLTMTWESLRADVQLALRHCRRAPGFAALVVLTLAIGVGANSAIFAAVHAVLLKPLPYDAPDRLVAVWSHHTKAGDPNYPVSPANYDAFSREATSFTRVEAMYSFLTNQQVALGDGSETIQASWVTPGMFGMLGRPALLGRGLQAGDEQSVVLSHGYWLRRFGGDRDIIGKPVPRPGGAPPYTVVGVMPEDFVFPYRSMLAPSGFSRAQQPDLWILLTPQTGFRMVDAAGQPSRTIHMLAVVARLKPNVTMAQAEADLTAIADRRAKDLPDSNDGFGITMRPLDAQTTGSVRPALVLLSAGVGVLLLLTCVNIANVLLARATGRRRDASVRAALGATRARLLQQGLVESCVLSLMGGAAALGLVAIGSRALLALAPADLPRLSETRLSLEVIVFTVGVAVLAGLLTGLLPSLTTARARAEDGLRDSRRTTGGRAQQAARSTLVVAEIALATLLTVGAGLLLRSFVSVLSVNPGFAPEHLLTFQVAAPPRYAGAANLIRFYDELREKLASIPGVTHVGGSTRIPLGSTQVSTQLSVEGRDVPPADLPEVQMRRAVHDYFGAMQIPVAEGRVFTDEDRRATEFLTVINQTLAARVFPGQSPIGQRVQMGANPRPENWMRIIGVVGDIRHTSLEEVPQPEIYISHLQGPPTSPFMAVRTTVEPGSVAASVREVVRSLGADAPANVRTMEELRSESVGERRFVVWLTLAFGVVALTLAAVGVYGVIALLVSERTSEVGIRLALGASPGQVWSMLVRQAATLGAIGVALGLAAGLLAAPLAAGMLFGVSAADPWTFGAVGALLLAIATIAAAIPARRAMAVDPATALRAQ
jgi:predicted permease